MCTVQRKERRKIQKKNINRNLSNQYYTESHSRTNIEQLEETTQPSTEGSLNLWTIGHKEIHKKSRGKREEVPQGIMYVTIRTTTGYVEHPRQVKGSKKK